jgi:hypothetical protein
MREQVSTFSIVTTVWQSLCRFGRYRVGGLALVLLASGLGACSESYNGGAACPVLCPTKDIAFRDTIIDAISVDTSLGGYPELGLSSLLLLANRPDTLETRGVIRFDVTPTSFLPNGGSASESITAVDSVYLTLRFDTTGSKGSVPVTIEAYDVDTTDNDSSQVVVKSLFRPDRLVASATMTPATAGDSLRIRLPNAFLKTKIDSADRVRIGLRMTNGAGQVRIVSFSAGTGAPSITFDPSTDTVYSPLTIRPSTSITDATTDVNFAYTVYGITMKGSLPPASTALQIGGFPAYRTYLRFDIPKRITDSSTIVRAEVLFTQLPSRFVDVNDSVSILPIVPTTTDVVTDLRRVLDLSADGFFASLDSTRLVPGDSGVRAINILTLARQWSALPSNVPRAIAFRMSGEGAQPAELRFYSSHASPALRPRVRITYLPRTQNAIP